MKLWQQMSKEEKKASYRYLGTGFVIGFFVTLVGIQDIGAGVINGLVLGFVAQLIYAIRN
jgi:hypothetical protein